jgi:ketosteroid isomerase-like protein
VIRLREGKVVEISAYTDWDDAVAAATG